MAFITASWILDIIILLFSIIFGFYLHFKLFASQHWRRRNIPYEEPRFIVGNTKDANRTKTLKAVFDELYWKHHEKPLLGIWTYVRPCILVFDVELIKNILVKDFSNFHDRGLTINEELEPLTAHLFNMSGHQWRNLRVKLTPTFTSGKMKMMYDTMYDVGLNLQKFLGNKEGKVIEVKEVLACFTTDIISSVVFGIESKSLENPHSEFRKYGKMVFEPPLAVMISAIVQFVAPFTAKMLSLRQMSKEVSDFFMKVVKDVIEYREKSNVKRKDFMELLIELKNKGSIEDADSKFLEKDETEQGSSTPTGDPFTVEQAAAQAFVFFFAGFETSSTTMMLTLYELACNPDIQKRLQTEIDEAVDKNNGDISYNTLQGMDYLDRVVQETLRKYPVVPMLFRECTKDYKVPGSGITLLKGDFLLIPIAAIQNDPQHFSNPSHFDPDRFSAETKSRDNQLHLAFGGGPRICIGARFGILQVKVGLALLLSKFNVEVCAETPIPIVFDPKQFIPCPQNGMPLKITKRPERNT